MKVEKSPNLAEVAITYRSTVKPSDRIQVTNSQAVYNVLKTVYNADTVEHVETAVALLLNQASHILGWLKLSEGGIAGTVVDVRVLFQHALLANATGIIISHNHPSGNIKPSEQDKMITKKVSEVGKIHEIRLMDHIIYTEHGYYSFADEAEI